MEYLEYFQLTSEPFSNAPLSRFYFGSRQHTEALNRLMYAASSMKGLAILIGDIGHGKTTLARRMLDALPEAEYEAAMLVIVHAGITPNWLLKRIASQLGVEHPADDKLSILSQLYQRLLQIYQQGKRAVVLIDEAQMLATRELMEEFRGLLNLEVPERKLITFIFFGLPDIERNLRLDPPLAQRIALRYHLKSLTAEDTAAYVEHRLRIAGAKRPLLPAPIINQVHELTRGVPRLINTLCDNVLLEMYFARRKVADAELVAAVAANLGLPQDTSDFVEEPPAVVERPAVEGSPGHDALVAVERRQEPVSDVPTGEFVVQVPTASPAAAPQPVAEESVEIELHDVVVDADEPPTSTAAAATPSDIEDPLDFISGAQTVTYPEPPVSSADVLPSAAGFVSRIDTAELEPLDIEVVEEGAELGFQHAASTIETATFATPVVEVESQLEVEVDVDDAHTDGDDELPTVVRRVYGGMSEFPPAPPPVPRASELPSGAAAKTATWQRPDGAIGAPIFATPASPPAPAPPPIVSSFAPGPVVVAAAARPLPAPQAPASSHPPALNPVPLASPLPASPPTPERAPARPAVPSPSRPPPTPKPAPAPVRKIDLSEIDDLLADLNNLGKKK